MGKETCGTCPLYKKPRWVFIFWHGKLGMHSFGDCGLVGDTLVHPSMACVALN